MSTVGQTLSMRLEKTENRLAWRAAVEELNISVIGYTLDDAIYCLGQALCGLAASAADEHKDLFDLIKIRG